MDGRYVEQVYIDILEEVKSVVTHPCGDQDRPLF